MRCDAMRCDKSCASMIIPCQKGHGHVYVCRVGGGGKASHVIGYRDDIVAKIWGFWSEQARSSAPFNRNDVVVLVFIADGSTPHRAGRGRLVRKGTISSLLYGHAQTSINGETLQIIIIGLIQTDSNDLGLATKCPCIQACMSVYMHGDCVGVRSGGNGLGKL